MQAWLALQYAVIACAVALSAWVVMAKQFPNALRRLRIACAAPLVREGRPAWARMLGRWIAPSPGARASKACSGCDNCGPD